jgi:tetratricopeptide (TPR) repeat protein
VGQGSATELVTQALENLKYGRYEAAEAAARSAIALEPGNADAHGALGIALSRLNKPEAALASLQEALRLSPESVKCFYNLAAHHFAVGDRAAAREMAERALELDPNHAPSRDLLLRIERDLSAPSGQLIPGPPVSQPVRPVHSISWIASLAWAWDVIGWFFFAALAFTFYRVDVVLRESLGGQSPTPELMMGAFQRLVDSSLPLFTALFVWFGLFCMWWALDLADRRMSAGIVTMSALGMLAVMCCPILTVASFAIYIMVRGRKQA